MLLVRSNKFALLKNLRSNIFVIFVVFLSFLSFTALKPYSINTFAQVTALQPSISDPNTKAADLRVMFNSLLKQHVDLSATAVRDGFDGFGSDEFKASTHALDNNSVAIADTIGTIYGADARGKFLEVWRKYIDYYLFYTMAVKNNNEVDKDEAKAGLDNITNELASLLNTANPNLKADDIRDLGTEHYMNILEIADSYATGDRQGAFDKQNEAYNHIGVIADNMALAIVQQFPGRF